MSFSFKSLARFLLILNFVGCSDTIKGTFLVPHFCVPIDYKRTNFFYKVGTKRSLWCKRGTFCSEFLSANGTHCSQIDELGLFCSEFPSVQIDELGRFCSEFPSVNGTHCSQIGKLRLFCSEFLSVNGTHCSQIGHLGLFCSKFLYICEWNTLFPN